MHYDNQIQTNCPVQFDVKQNKTNKKLVCSYLRCAYNHTLLEKPARLWSKLIHCLTSRNWQFILGMALSLPVTFLTGNHIKKIGFDRIMPLALLIRDLGTRLSQRVTHSVHHYVSHINNKQGTREPQASQLILSPIAAIEPLHHQVSHTESKQCSNTVTNSGNHTVRHWVSHINSKQGSHRVTNSVNHSVRHWVSPPLRQSHRQQTSWPESH